MKKIVKVDNFSKITSLNNSSNKSSNKEKSKNIEEKINRIKNLKKLFLSSSKLPEQNNSNLNNKPKLNEELKIKNLLQKKDKNFSFTTNKFYHSSLSSVSFSPKFFNKKRIKSEKNKKNEKIVVLQLNNKNTNDKYLIISDSFMKINKYNEDNKFYSTNFSTNYNQELSINSINELHSNNLFKNKISKIKKSSSNNEINYFNYIHQKHLKLNNLRKIKRENISHVSSNAISNELLNKYENIMIKKDISDNREKIMEDYLNSKNNNNSLKLKKGKNKLRFYSFKDIINGLTRNINLIGVSHSNEFNLKLLRNIDELKKFPYLSKTQRENKDDKGFNINTYNYLNNKDKPIKEKLFLSDDDVDIKEIFNEEINIKETFNDDINFKEIFNIDDYQESLQTKQSNNIKYILNENNNNNKNIFKKNKLSTKEDIEKNDIKEDLKLFLGNSNKLNWNLISEKDKHKGKEIWKKIINLKKDIGINCDSNKDINEIHDTNINKSKDIFTPKSNIKNDIKNKILFSKEKTSEKKQRKTIILNPKMRLEPIKINNHPFSIRSNSIFKINTKFKLNENVYKKNNNSNIKEDKEKKENKKPNKVQRPRFSLKKYNIKILKNLKEKKKIIYNKSPSTKKIKRKISDDESSSESDLDIINEEAKSINNNKNINEQEEQEDDYDEEEKNNDINNNKSDNIKEILTAPVSFVSRENTIENKENDNNEEDQIPEEKSEEEKNEEQNKEENSNQNNEEKNKENISKDEEEKQEEKKEGSNNKKKEIKYRMKEKKSEVQDISIFQQDEYSQQLILKKLRGKKRKSKIIKPSIYTFLRELKNKGIISSPKKERPVNKPRFRKYFKNVDLKNLQDINKRKIELLFKIKHDLEFKIKKGDIKSLENLEFKDLEQKIYTTKIQTFDINGINEYLDKLEGFFNSFENDINIAENRKKEEERINGFRNDLIYKMDFAEILREKKERVFGSVIDFININHINELSDLENMNKKENEKELKK